MNEIWKDIKGYEGYYQVSNLGRARSLDRIVIDKRGFEKKCSGRILKPALYSNGYEFVRFYPKKFNQFTWSIHRIVMNTFKPNVNGENLEVNHKDGNKRNNNLDNLEWVTKSENTIHAITNKLRKKAYTQRPVTITNVTTGEMIEFENAKLACEFFQKNRGWITDTSRAKGCNFEYKGWDIQC